MIKSPLRYPGGKSRVAKFLASTVPPNCVDYREPFVGGGSVFIYLAQTRPDVKIWINDSNPEVYHFWLTCKHQLPELVVNLQKTMAIWRGAEDEL